jgi:NADPH-dependent 2,4-dienoyl-CoA reductase/sulfur reductase-like enzyme
MKASMPKGADPASVIDYLIVGGGLAGATAADTLRREGAAGSVAILSAEVAGRAPPSKTPVLRYSEPD